MEAPASPTLTAGQRPAAPIRAPQRRRRRPAVLALGVALIAAGGLGGSALYLTTGQRVGVLALTQDVPVGQPITAGDLTVVRISLDPALKPLNSDSHVLGMRATTDLKAGQLLTGADLTNDPLVDTGEQVVGLAAKPTQLPASGVQAGAWVVMVFTPSAVGNGSATGGSPTTSGGSSNNGGSGNSGSGGSGGSAAAGTGAAQVQSITLRVVDVGQVSQSDGTVVVDVAVPPQKAAAVADLAASGRFMLLLAATGAQGGGG
ncbi:SAF domain-containing protein [Streptacidiphilus fuscans]|uniref:Flagella basal body P-ring formation protein FlgA n=1 Tax=Streptacidiphilus fuscans TaxID=2789292 RepID=A0A931FAN6_9ACTN|nr:SAF domain-containing protein [Streptacidiphilus fuscans]MBF9066588.1 flagella basal body P-ring formation protein FlgA [Streptacidiphilus fuscans]